jgi:transcriptional regulator
MYLPKHFEETRVETLHELIRAHPLGALVTLTPGGLDANHIPFEVDPDPAPLGTLRGHVARVNPVWRVAGEVEALVLFQGPETYISPSWYPTKQETAKVVPTWNYVVVHAHGHVRFIEDRAWLRAFVERLTTRHEAGRRDPWKVTDAPPDYIDRQLDAIVGLEVPIGRLIGKWKVSQNRPPADRAGVVEGLLHERHPPAATMAELVRRSRSD